MRVAVFTSHPIQYQAPWFRALAEQPDLVLKVYFSHVPDAAEQGKGFGQSFRWDTPLRDGYDSVVLGTKRVSRPAPDFARRVAFGIDLKLQHFAPDVAVVMGWHELPLVQAFLACRRRDIPIVIRGESNVLRSRPRLVAAVHRAYIALAAAALAIGDSNAAFYRQAGMPGERIAMARYFVDNRFFADAVEALRPARAALRANWNIPQDALCVLFAGKLEPKKRILDALNAMRIGREIGAKLHLLIAGSGAEQAQATSLAADHRLPVTFAGFLNQSEIGRAYTAADALLLPSDYGETWGLVVNEAMATGLPAIVSDRVGCAGDLVVHGRTGAIVPFNAPDAIARVLARWAEDPALVRRMGLSAREHVQEGYTISAAVAGLRHAAAIAMRTPRHRASHSFDRPAA